MRGVSRHRRGGAPATVMRGTCSGDRRAWSRALFCLLVAGCLLMNCLSARAQEGPTSPEQIMSHGFDCFSCHAIDKEVVGPAWITIADRYHHDLAKVPYLAAKIRDG